MQTHASQLSHCDDPVFIVGAPRTASSFLCSSLIESAGFAGSNEGHLLPLLDALDQQVVGYYAMLEKQGMLDIPGNSIARVPQHAMRHAVLDLFRNVSAMLFGNTRWVDKTVNSQMMNALPHLLAAWPKSSVIYLRRNGISNVQSALAYFNVGFEECCRNWARCGEVWDRIYPLLPKNRVLEIGHDDLLNAPSTVANQVAELLGLTEQVRTCLNQQMVSSVNAWSKGRAVEATLEGTDWSVAERRIFIRICGDQMVSQGHMHQGELVRLRNSLADPQEISIPANLARALSVDDPMYFKSDGDSLYVVPGRDHAALVTYERLLTTGVRALNGTLDVAHQSSQGVRFEFIGTCRRTGAIILVKQIEVVALTKQDFSVEFAIECDEMDLLVRVTRGAMAETNDYSWGHLTNLRLVKNNAMPGLNS